MKLTKTMIRGWCSNADYNRGRKYYLEHKVRHFSSSISEEMVSAHCVVDGTRRYDVSLRIAHSALVAQCTCPRCADTGSCKHIAAALLRLEQQMKEVSVTQVMGTVKERRELMDAVADGSEEGILTMSKEDLLALLE